MSLREKLEATIKVGNPSRDYKVELQKMGEHVYNGKKYVTYGGKASSQDIVRATEVLRRAYPDWDVFANTRSRTIVFRRKI